MEQRLQIIDKCDYITKSGKKMPGYLCKCKCGNTKIVSKINFDSGKTRSCGCLIRDFNKTKIGNTYSRLRKIVIAQKELSPDSVRIKRIWKNMKGRCENPNSTSYQIYGGRGITVCQEWSEDFMSFYNWAIKNGYKNDLSIERIDVNGNYEPSNCRWATTSEQARNTRRNVYIKYNGSIYIITDLANKLGVPKECLSPLAKRGIELRGEV